MEWLILRILVAVQNLLKDQLLYAKVQFILVPSPHFQLVPLTTFALATALGRTD